MDKKYQILTKFSNLHNCLKQQVMLEKLTNNVLTFALVSCFLIYLVLFGPFCQGGIGNFVISKGCHHFHRILSMMTLVANLEENFLARFFLLIGQCFFLNLYSYTKLKVNLVTISFFTVQFILDIKLNMFTLTLLNYLTFCTLCVYDALTKCQIRHRARVMEPQHLRSYESV